jgi:hypothetical protein
LGAANRRRAKRDFARALVKVRRKTIFGLQPKAIIVREGDVGHRALANLSREFANIVKATSGCSSSGTASVSAPSGASAKRSTSIGDSAYGSAEMLGWLVHEHGIEPHVTVFDKSARQDGTFSRDDFTYDHARDLYLCPGDKKLTTTGTLVNDNATMLYRASKHDCAACALKLKCCPNTPARKVRAPSTRAHATWRDRLLNPGRAEPLGGSAKRLRCCLPISNAFSS